MRQAEEVAKGKQAGALRAHSGEERLWHNACPRTQEEDRVRDQVWRNGAIRKALYPLGRLSYKHSRHPVHFACAFRGDGGRRGRRDRGCGPGAWEAWGREDGGQTEHRGDAVRPAHADADLLS